MARYVSPCCMNRGAPARFYSNEIGVSRIVKIFPLENNALQWTLVMVRHFQVSKIHPRKLQVLGEECI